MSQTLNDALLRPNGEDPVVDKLAAVVAGWSARKQAQLLIAVGYGLERQLGVAGAQSQSASIGHAIVVEERELADRYGTHFIFAMAKIVVDAQVAEAST